jgi:hypothetical protein
MTIGLLGLGLIFSPSPPRIAPFVRARDLAADYPNLGDASFMAPIRQSLFAVLMSSAMLSAPLLVLPAPFAEAARGGGRTEVLPAQKSAPSVVAIDRTASEDDLRKEMREKNSVGELSANGQFSQAPTGRFGFIAPRMLGMALVTQSPDLGLSRTPQDKASFEVHKLADGSGMLVGFVARDQLSELTSAQRPKTLRIALHSNASEKAPVIVAVPIVKLMADRMPFKLDPQGHGGPMVIDMDLQGTANRQKTQGGP